MTSSLTTFVAKTKLLSSKQLSPLGQAALSTLREKGYTIGVGLPEDMIGSIRKMAQESSIQEYCLNDSTNRFKNKAAAAHWLSHGRVVFLLFRQTENGKKELAGYGWVGTKTHSRVAGGQATFAVRIGEAHQGLGLATPYTRAMLDAAIRVFDFNHLWLEAWASNANAIHVYQKLGLRVVAEQSDTRIRPNGEQVPDNRLYMELAGPLL